MTKLLEAIAANYSEAMLSEIPELLRQEVLFEEFKRVLTPPCSRPR